MFSFSLAQNQVVSNYTKLRDNESLINKIDVGIFKFFSNQIYNNSLNKYQKIIDYRLNKEIFDKIFFNLQYVNTLDKTYYSKIRTRVYDYSATVDYSIVKYISFKNRIGYKNERYKVIQHDLDSLINNDGLYDSLTTSFSFKDIISSYNNIIFNNQKQTSYKELSSRNFYFFSLKHFDMKFNFNFAKAIRKIPKRDFTQNKDEFNYSFYTNFNLKKINGLSITGKIVLDSLSNDFYKNQGFVINKRIQKFFFHNFRFNYELNKNLKFFIEESFQRSNFKYFFDFDNFIYRNYNLKLSLLWMYDFYIVEFIKYLEKDYFHYLDELNFNDNDQLRDFLSIKLFFNFQKFNTIFEFTNLRKRFVYISKYVSINNYFNNRYSLSLNFNYHLNNKITVIDSLYFASDYIYYEYVPKQNTAIFIFDQILGFKVKFSDNFILSIKNNFNRRDNGYYLSQNNEERFYFYNNRLRKRNLLEIKTIFVIFDCKIASYYNIRRTKYFRFSDMKFNVANVYTEYFYGVDVMKNSDYTTLDINIGKQHYYGYDYWLFSVNVGLNF